MAFAISLKAVNDTAGPVRALWEGVAHFERQPSMATLDYPPHLTLAIYDDISPVRLKAVLGEAFAGTSALRLVFARLQFFDNPLVLWAEPRPSTDLAAAHRRVHACIDPQLCRPHYRPGAWIPHCTLGTEILAERREEAIAFTAHPVAAFEVIFDVADCVSFAPVAVIDERRLALREPSVESPSP
jgi:2'-5' RNA ligase